MSINSSDNHTIAESSAQDAGLPPYKQVRMGCFYIIHSVIYIIPYVPCILVIMKKPLINYSCFKIMLAMAIPDLGTMLVNGFSGIFSVLGIPIDEHFILNKSFGAIANAMWYLYGALNILLAFNRCVDLGSATLSMKLFAGNKAWIWISCCMAWALFIFALFMTEGTSLIYHSGLGVFIFVGQNALLYNTIWNWMLTICLPVLYVQVWVLLRRKMSLAQNQQQSADKERRTILQAFLISFVATLGAIVYVTYPMANVDVNLFWTATVTFQVCAGCNCVIYLTINLTIRRRVIEMVFGKKLNRVGGVAT